MEDVLTVVESETDNDVLSDIVSVLDAVCDGVALELLDAEEDIVKEFVIDG